MPPPSTPALAQRQLSYAPVGLTLAPLGAVPGFRAFEARVAVGAGDACWRRASRDVLRWAVKIRSGFTVPAAAGPVRAGEDFWVYARFGPVTIREPVRVVAVIEQPDRAGFAYGTLTGHPVSGEESFTVERGPDGGVHFVLRSLTRAAPGPRGLLLPGALLAQRVYRGRYLRSLG